MTGSKWVLILAGAIVAGLVGLALGLPVQALLFLAIVAACPLMMFAMHGAGHEEQHDVRRAGAGHPEGSEGADRNGGMR